MAFWARRSHLVFGGLPEMVDGGREGKGQGSKGKKIKVAIREIAVYPLSNIADHSSFI
jgi:hypothetical protein